MTKKQKIRRLGKQNEALRKKNIELREKTPTVEYAKQIDKSVDKFEGINDELLKLYKELHKARIQRKNTFWRYKFGILKIRIKQKMKL